MRFFLLKVIFVCFFCQNVFAGNVIWAETYDEQSNNSNQASIRLRILNNSSDTLNNIQIRYVLKHEANRKLIFSPYYLPNCNLSLDTLGEYILIKIDILKLNPGYYPSKEGLVFGINYSNYENLHKEEHYSYLGTSNFTRNKKILLYKDDLLLEGKIPNVLFETKSFFMESLTELLLTSGEKVLFSWREIDDAILYQLSIFSKIDSSLIFQQETNNTNIEVKLDEGEYWWNVKAVNTPVGFSWGYPIDSLKEDFETWNELNIFFDEIISDSIAPLTSPKAARKDTYLLDLKWGEMALDREWDKPHLHHAHYDEEESYRCWIVGAQILNHYYGGDITQDEIKIHFKQEFKVSIPFLQDSSSALILGSFLHYSQGGADSKMLIVDSMMHWVLNDYTMLNRNDRRPTETEISNYLKQSIPLYIWGNGHVMVLDAYKRTLTGKFFVRVVNTDNNGRIAWISLESLEIDGFMAPQVIGNVRKTEPLIHLDTDGDGVMDYDEQVRFGTNVKKKDSDGDEVDDKTEIFSYVIVEKLPDLNRTIWKMGISKLTMADIDNDGLRAEHDVDSDAGGKSDGDEDLNKNGLIDDGESNPYDINDDLFESKKMFIPDSIIFYGIGSLKLNDYVKCWYDTKKCNVASESYIDEFGITIGRSAQVNAIYSKGGVFLRDGAVVSSHIRFYTLPNRKLDLTVQNNTKYNYASFSLLEKQWPYKIDSITLNADISFQHKEIFFNEIYILKDGDSFKSLKLHSGATLQIEPGEMFIGDIHLEAGSKIQFTHPGMQTIFHLNGSTIWRSKTLNDNFFQVAKGFMAIQHSSNTMIIEGQWCGTIVAPKADLILGQSNKSLYGQFLGKNITVHQYTTVYGVNFKPDFLTEIVFKGK